MIRLAATNNQRTKGESKLYRQNPIDNLLLLLLLMDPGLTGQLSLSQRGLCLCRIRQFKVKVASCTEDARATRSMRQHRGQTISPARASTVALVRWVHWFTGAIERTPQEKHTCQHLQRRRNTRRRAMAETAKQWCSIAVSTRSRQARLTVCLLVRRKTDKRGQEGGSTYTVEAGLVIADKIGHVGVMLVVGCPGIERQGV